jgi:hypothetical protein
VKRRGDAPERSSRRRIKGKGVKVGLCLLQAKLERRSLAGVRRHEGPKESSTRVTAVMGGSGGSDRWSSIRSSRTTVAGVEDAAI